MNEQSIFLEAVEIDEARQRAAFLEQACGDDQELRNRVEELLREHERSGDFLNIPALDQMRKVVGVTREMGDEATSRDEPKEEADFSFLQPSEVPGSLGRMGHYDIRKIIGRGGCGIVFQAFDERLHRIVAIKVMTPEMAATSPARKRFLREARATAAIRHKNVVSIHAVEESPVPFLVMEYLDGKTLQQLIDETGPLDLSIVLRFGRMIANGLAAAHRQGLIHRDIKPANILIESGTGLVKITDFGLARAVDDASMTQSGVIAGTPLYMSPEQARGTSIDSRSDLFSLGSVLYVMCSGRPPFRAPSTFAVLKRVVDEEPRNIREIIPEVPHNLTAIIAKLHQKDPRERPASALEVSRMLAACLPKETSHAADPPQPAPPNRQRHPHWGKAVAAVLVMLLFCFGVSEATGVTNVRGTVIRLFSPAGTLIIEVDDPGVSVSVDGEELVMTGTGAKEVRVKPGQHQVTASKDGKALHQELVTISREGRQIMRVTQEPAATKPSDSPSLLDIPLPDRFTNQIGMEFAKVPAGTAWLWGDSGLSGHQRVDFLHDFYIGRYEVTQAEWQSLLDNNPSYFRVEGEGNTAISDLSATDQGKLPVESVSYFDVQHFIDALNSKEADKEWKYRLPTELEWEYACRGGPVLDREDGGFNYYSGTPRNTLTDTEGNFNVRLGRTAVVGQYAPNRLGLHDLHGNVEEWCLPGGKSGNQYRQCGGSWSSPPERCRTVDRPNVPPTSFSRTAGFRLVRVRVSDEGPQVRPELPPEQRATLDWILSHGGKLIAIMEGKELVLNPGARLPEGITRIDTVDLEGIRLLDETNVARLRHLPKVRNVLMGSFVNDKMFASLMSYPGIINLDNLDIKGAAISDDSLAQLHHLSNHFFGLVLSNSQISAKGIKHLQGLTNAGVLLKECRNIDDEACRVLASTPRWHWLGLTGTSITDAGLQELHACRKLVAIDVVRCPVTEDGVRKLAAALPSCRIEWDGGFIEPKPKSPSQ